MVMQRTIVVLMRVHADAFSVGRALSRFWRDDYSQKTGCGAGPEQNQNYRHGELHRESEPDRNRKLE
jgi:hypothetical protein